jgi:anti-anti-sigma factor
MGTSGLKIAETHSGSVCVAALTGRVDNSTAIELQNRLTTLIEGGEKCILLDLAGVSVLTSAAFRALLVATSRAKRSDARLALCSVAGHVRELFDLAGLLEVFPSLGSRDEALAKLP